MAEICCFVAIKSIENRVFFGMEIDQEEHSLRVKDAVDVFL